jgi:hypothetical protein
MGWDHVILAMDSLLMAVIVLRSGMSPSAMSFLWATHLGSAILLYQGYQRRVVIGAIAVAIGSSYLGSGSLFPSIRTTSGTQRSSQLWSGSSSSSRSCRSPLR